MYKSISCVSLIVDAGKLVDACCLLDGSSLRVQDSVIICNIRASTVKTVLSNQHKSFMKIQKTGRIEKRN